MWIENSQLCLINPAHEHFITQTGKKSKTALKNFMGPRGPGPWSRCMGSKAEKNKYPLPNIKEIFLQISSETVHNVIGILPCVKANCKKYFIIKRCIKYATIRVFTDHCSPHKVRIYGSVKTRILTYFMQR